MTIYLEPNEEITSVVDHLIRSDAEEIIFVIPIAAQILQSLINLKLLKREADNLKKKIIIITQDQHGQKLAERAGIEIYSSKDKIDHFLNNLASTIETMDLKEEASPEFIEGDYLAPLPGGEEPDILFVKNEQGRKIPLASSAGGFRRVGGPLRVTDIIKPETPPFYFPSDKEKLIKGSSRSAGHRAGDFDAKKDRIGAKFTEDESGPSLIAATLSQLSPKRVLALLVCLFLTVGFFIGWFVLPRVEITLYPKTELSFLEIAVKVDKNIFQTDFLLNRIPGQMIKLEKIESGEFLSSGEKQVNEKARGIITVYNEYSSSPQILVETTRFLSKEGKLFRLTKAIVVPGAKVEEGKIVPSSIAAEAIADEPGEAYNIAPADFTIPGFKGTPKYDAFYGRSSLSMSGGVVGKVKIISQDDFDNAKKILFKDLRERVYQQIKDEIPTGFKLLDIAISEKIDPISISPAVGSQATKFTLNTKIILGGLIFNESDLKELIKKDIESQVSSQRKLFDKSITIDYKKASADFDSGVINLDISAEGKTMKKIDIDKLKEQIRGKSEEKIKEIFSALEVESAKINFWPLWIKKIPKRLDKIKIII